MNVKLLRQIQRRIKKEPRQFFMKWFFRRSKSIPNCHTAACIAGWALTISGTKTKKPSDAKRLFACRYFSPAAKTLGLDDRQAERLFAECSWPVEFLGAKRTLANRAIARIEHMIKTGE